MKKFNQLENGYIKIIDGDDIFEVGDSKNNLKCEINIHSIDFYVFLGSGGLLGATEAYAAGLWSCSDLVVLTLSSGKGVVNKLTGIKLGGRRRRRRKSKKRKSRKSKKRRKRKTKRRRRR